MSNQITKTYQFKGTISFQLASDALKNVNFVHIRKGDLTTQFSPIAQAAFNIQGLEVDEVRIMKNAPGNAQYLQLITKDKTALSQDVLSQLTAGVGNVIASHPIIDEHALLNWASQNILTHQPDSLEHYVDQYIRSEVIPTIKRSTATKERPEGHDVGIGFARFVKHGEGVKIAMTMSNDCGSCTTAFLSTVQKCNDMVGDYLKNANVDLPLSGVIVLPTNGGSSFTLDRKPKPLVA